MTKTVTKNTTITTTTKRYEAEAKVELKPIATKLDDGLILSPSSQNSPNMKTLPYESGGNGVVGGPKLVEFEILYDNTSSIFTGGDTMTGKLRIALRESMKMRLIKLQFKGRSCVTWSENKLAKDGSSSKQACKTERVFFDKEIILLERRPGQEIPADFVLPAGIHVLPFIFPIPKNIPTSFEGDHGSIRYFCRAIIVKPWKFDHVTKRAFTILSPQSAVRDPSLMKPITVSERTTVKSMCCFTGHVTCEIGLPKQIYSPGETVTVGAKISNLSRKQVIKAVVSLVQLVTYRIGSKEGHEKSVTSTRVVAECIIEKPLHDGKVHWNQEPMFRVPSISPSCVDEAMNILRIEYEIRVELSMAGGKPTDSLLGRLPVAIVLATTPSIQSTGVSSNGAIAGNKSTKYVDAVFGRVNIREDDENQYVRGQLEFAPIYPLVET